MGNRISIQFQNGEDKSPVLFSHWGGDTLLDDVGNYLKELDTELEQKDKHVSEPIDRHEPRTIIIDFIRWLTKDMKRVSSDLYMGFDQNDGDNSDNGHYIVDLKENWKDWKHDKHFYRE